MSSISTAQPRSSSGPSGAGQPGAQTAGGSASTSGSAALEQSDSFESTSTHKQRKAAERALARAGISPGKVDGKIKPRTRRALRRFQKARGLEQSGELDQRTFKALTKLSRRLRKKGGRKVDSAGMQSKRIRDAEKRLRRLGYDTGKVDGLYTRKTASAVAAFKADQQGIDNTSGLLGGKARAALRREQGKLGHQPYRSRVKNTAAHKRAEARVERAVRREHDDGSRGIRRGARGPAVETVQRHLRAAGYNPKRVDGVFDQRTEGVVKEFQRRKGLEPSGRVNPKTWQQLRKAQMEASGPTSPAQRVGEHSRAVKKTEQLLRKLGYKPGPADGLYTRRTQRAVDRFRRDYGKGGRGHGVGPNTLKQIKKAVREGALGPTQTVTGYVQGRARKIKVVKVDGELMETSTARAFVKMKRAAARDGINLDLISGFRSNSEQAYLYDGWINRRPGFNPAAPPGYSNHQSGAAIDLAVGTGSSYAVGVGATYNWLARNAHRFGFKRIASEAWHWEYQPLLNKYR